jgi:hypothetical protein
VLQALDVQPSGTDLKITQYSANIGEAGAEGVLGESVTIKAGSNVSFDFTGLANTEKSIILDATIPAVDTSSLVPTAAIGTSGNSRKQVLQALDVKSTSANELTITQYSADVTKNATDTGAILGESKVVKAIDGVTFGADGNSLTIGTSGLISQSVVSKSGNTRKQLLQALEVKPVTTQGVSELEITQYSADVTTPGGLLGETFVLQIGDGIKVENATGLEERKDSGVKTTVGGIKLAVDTAKVVPVTGIRPSSESNKRYVTTAVVPTLSSAKELKITQYFSDVESPGEAGNHEASFTIKLDEYLTLAPDANNSSAVVLGLDIVKLQTVLGLSS